ncbi:hypothetical protein PHMEG_00030795 [Phytophthora megakarya]|uniref:Uncharacterized protein n=1 Tax=Phytophthora megakarya TaxID=4795 RepID=A0A225UZ90_9STRA|nr:hypothetical protein PHMEG_00030795 [Phytophthora megakarya]
MLTDLAFGGVRKLLLSDKPIHHLLPGYMAQLMVAQMIDWGTLYCTP